MRYLFTLLVLLSTTLLSAQNQDLKLAQQFLRSGDYEKASSIFSKMYDAQPNNTYYYQNLFKCYVNLEDYEAAEELIAKHKKKNKRNAQLSTLVDLGYIYFKQDKVEKAEQQYEEAISGINKNTANQVRTLASSFLNIDAVKYAIRTYEKGREFDNKPDAYAYELGRTYQKAGDSKKTIDYYLDVIIYQPQRENWIKTEFQKLIPVTKYRDHFEEQLYKRTQKDPDEIKYPELLAWLYMSEKDYESALIQVKALDRRLNESGERVFAIAKSALIENEYETAIEAYDYIIDKGDFNNLFEPARRAKVSAQMKAIEYSNEYDNELLSELESDYLNILQAFGRTPDNIPAIRELSKLYAFYIHDLDKAIGELEQVTEMASADKKLVSECKLDLGDYYIMYGDIWEASLLYSQVDKAYKEDELGEDARYRNAKLSYYNGDFSWAQSQLNVLKASTSELIANDALELSVFIMDNLGLDTSTVAMSLFSNADLLIFQNRIEEALVELDKIETQFPAHILGDDILYRRSEIAYKQKDYAKCANYFEQIIENYPEEILVDNALFGLAELYERQLDDEEKAMNYYEEIILNQEGSLFIVEARKRFRRLRGDNVN